VACVTEIVLVSHYSMAAGRGAASFGLASGVKTTDCSVGSRINRLQAALSSVLKPVIITLVKGVSIIRY